MGKSNALLKSIKVKCLVKVYQPMLKIAKITEMGVVGIEIVFFVKNTMWHDQRCVKHVCGHVNLVRRLSKALWGSKKYLYAITLLNGCTGC